MTSSGGHFPQQKLITFHPDNFVIKEINGRNMAMTKNPTKIKMYKNMIGSSMGLVVLFVVVALFQPLIALIAKLA